MRLLIDNALSPFLAAALSRAEHDAVHVRDVGLGAADDETILKFDETDMRIVVSADTDFGTLLSIGKGKLPSVILIRRGAPRAPERQAALLVANLPPLEEELLKGAIVTFQGNRLRIRRLPIAER